MRTPTMWVPWSVPPQHNPTALRLFRDETPILHTSDDKCGQLWGVARRRQGVNDPPLKRVGLCSRWP